MSQTEKIRLLPGNVNKALLASCAHIHIARRSYYGGRAQQAVRGTADSLLSPGQQGKTNFTRAEAASNWNGSFLFAAGLPIGALTLDNRNLWSDPLRTTRLRNTLLRQIESAMIIVVSR